MPLHLPLASNADDECDGVFISPFHVTGPSKGTNVEKLLKLKADLDSKIRALLTSDGPLTEDQKKEHENLKSQLADCKARIATLKELDATAAQEKADEAAEVARLEEIRVTAEREKRNAPTGRITQPDTQANVVAGSQGRTIEDAHETVHFQIGYTNDAVKRQTYEETKRRYDAQARSMGYMPRGEFKTLGEYIRAGLNSSNDVKLENRIVTHCKGLVDDRGNFLRPQGAVLGASESVASDGGYFVMPEFSGRILDKIYTGNNLWSRTDNYTITGNNMTFIANAETSRATGSRAGGLRGYWMGEGGSITASKPTTREVSLKLVKLGVVVYFTNELLADGGQALEDYTVKKAADEFNFMIGDSLVNGTGAGQPLGLLNWPSLISVAKETGQAAASLQIENIEKMYARFYAPEMPEAYWYTNQDTGPQLNLMTLGIGAAGVPVYMPVGAASAAPYATLKGRPLETTEFNATLGTQGDLILADMGDMLSISKGGVAQAVSMHIQFLTDQMAVRFTMRLNAGPWWNAALTPYKGSATQSTAVTLDTRA